MTPFEREELKRRAEAKLAAMRERAARLRRRVLAAAAIGFVVLWIAIFAQMISGHDPALGPATATVRSASVESVAADPERRTQTSASSEEGDEEGGEAWSETAGFEAEQVEAQAQEAEAAELEAAELEAAEAEELEAATTGQS